MELNWYTFNIFTLAVDIVITAFALFALFSALEEKKKAKQMLADAEKKTKTTKYGRKL